MQEAKREIAYLILAHNHPEQLSRMIDRLQHEAVEFFVHVDKKSAIAPFRSAVGGKNRVNLIEERHAVNWRGFSQIHATMALMRAALPRGARYYILLSGADYPVKPNGEILRFLHGKDTQYLHYFSLYDIPGWLRKIRHYYYWDFGPTNPRHGYAPIRWRYKKYIQRGVLERLPERTYLKGIHPYGGSQWWMLTRECVQYCLDFLENNFQFRMFYRFTDSPDEMVFQTIILNSPFADSAVNYRQYRDNRQRVISEILTRPLGFCPYNYRYIDWYSPQRGLPAILNDTNFEEMVRSNALFARKFDPRISHSLLDRIDRELLGTIPRPAPAQSGQSLPHLGGYVARSGANGRPSGGIR